MPPQRAYYITQRVKRGFHDTSKPGAFLKDFIYMSGIEKVKKFLSHDKKTKIRKLYTGKIGLGDMGFAQRLRSDSELRGAVDAWFAAHPERPSDVPARDWLRFEQDKHERLLAAAAQLT